MQTIKKISKWYKVYTEKPAPNIRGWLLLCSIEVIHVRKWSCLLTL